MRVRRVHPQIGGARLRIHLEYVLPGLAAVRRAVNAPFLTGTPDLPLHADVGNIVILRMDPDARYLARVRQAYVGPGVTGVGRLVDSVAVTRRHAANRFFTRPNVNDVCVGLGNRDGADRANIKVPVRDVFPTDSCVFGLPDAAAGGAHVIELRVIGHASHGRHSPAAIGPDHPPLHNVEECCVDSLRRLTNRQYPQKRCYGCKREFDGHFISLLSG